MALWKWKNRDILFEFQNSPIQKISICIGHTNQDNICMLLRKVGFTNVLLIPTLFIWCSLSPSSACMPRMFRLLNYKFLFSKYLSIYLFSDICEWDLNYYALFFIKTGICGTGWLPELNPISLSNESMLLISWFSYFSYFFSFSCFETFVNTSVRILGLAP